MRADDSESAGRHRYALRLAFALDGDPAVTLIMFIELFQEQPLLRCVRQVPPALNAP